MVFRSSLFTNLVGDQLEWISLLTATVRLIDLHDSDRAYGAPPNFTRESRTGNADGVYLDIAFHVIHRLKLLDQSASQDYLPFASILGAVRDERADVAETDVQYVLNVLRRPCEIFYLAALAGQPTRECHSDKRETALVEKTDYADEYRLSSTGRLLLSLSNAVRDSTYLRGDVYNLLQAIEFRDFPKILAFSDGIVSLLRNEILDVRAALERVGRTDTIDRYLDRLDQYRQVIEDTLRIAQLAEGALAQSDVLDAFLHWQETTDNEITFEHLRNRVNHVRQVLLTFNRLLSELITLALQGDRSAVPPPSFLDIAAQLVRRPLSADKQHILFRQWGPVLLETPFHSSLDGLGAVKLRATLSAVTPMAFLDEYIEPISHLGKARFLDRHGLSIANALHAGPLRLSDAINRGWFIVDADIMLGDLIGVFVAPAGLPVDGNIEISVAAHLTEKHVGTGQFLFTELELSIMEAA